MKIPALFAIPAIAFSTAALLQAQSPSAPYQVTQKTEVPGASLSPGSYTVRIADHLNDRLIVQVQKSGGHDVTTLLAYPNSNLTGSGPVLFGTGLKNKPTLRGFAFAGGPAVEFVYPKADAVTLAKANDLRVMAVDPASEGRPKLPQLTQSDMNEVTLWMLTPTPVQPGGGAPGIQAARYQPSSAPAPVEVASNTPPPSPAYRAARSSRSSVPAEPAQSTPAPSTPRAHIRPAVKQLPHTASNLPLIALTGLLSLGLAGGMRLGRKVRV